MRNDDAVKEHERLLKSIGRIFETVPKSYRAEHACWSICSI